MNLSIRWISAGLLLIAIAAILLFIIPSRWKQGSEDSTAKFFNDPSASEIHNTPFSERKVIPHAIPSDEWPQLFADHNLHDPSGAIESLLTIQDSTERAKAFGSMISRWILENPRALLDYLDSKALAAELGEAEWGSLLHDLGEGLSYVKEPAASSTELAAAIRRIIHGMAEENPDQALSWAEEWLLDDALDQARATVAGKLAATSPDQAIELISTITSQVRRHEAINLTSRAMAEIAPERALQWSQSLNNETESSLAVNGTLVTLSATDPVKASEIFSEFSKKLYQSHTQRLNSEKANLLADGYTKSTDELGNEVFIKGDQEVHFSPLNPETELMREAIGQIARDMSTANPATALAWAQQLPEGVLRYRGMEAAVLGAAETTPQVALQQMREVFPSQTGPAEALFQIWATENPTQALQAISQLNGTQKDAAITGVTAGWLDHGEKYTTVRQWAGTLPKGNGRDNALLELVQTASLEFPEETWADALEISNDQKRLQAIKVALPALIRKNPQLAHASANSRSFSQNEKALIERMLGNTATQHR